MADPIVGEIRIFSGSFNPQGWLLCNGSIVPVNDYQVLYALIGNTYGGSGPSTFALPDLRGRLAIGQGSGSGLTPRTLGQSFGTEVVTLTQASMPTHTHSWMASTVVSTVNQPQNQLLGAQASELLYDQVTDPTKYTSLIANAVSVTGGGGSHDNVMPSMALNYIICYQGIFPSRN